MCMHLSLCAYARAYASMCASSYACVLAYPYGFACAYVGWVCACACACASTYSWAWCVVPMIMPSPMCILHVSLCACACDRARVWDRPCAAGPTSDCASACNLRQGLCSCWLEPKHVLLYASAYACLCMCMSLCLWICLCSYDFALAWLHVVSASLCTYSCFSPSQATVVLMFVPGRVFLTYNYNGQGRNAGKSCLSLACEKILPLHLSIPYVCYWRGCLTKFDSSSKTQDGKKCSLHCFGPFFIDYAE